MKTLMAQYRQLPALAGALFLPIGFLARLPTSMIQLGTVLLVTTATGDLAYGGLTAGALALGMAVGGPVIGWLADRFGQRPVIVIASLTNAGLAVALVVEVGAAADRWLVLPTAIAVGCSTPQIGPLIRSRWVTLTAGDARLGPAMSWEGTADEVAYVLGPAVVSLLALISPPVALLGAAVLVGVFGTWVGLHHTATSAVATIPTARVRPPWRNPVVARLLIISACIGTFFGGTQTGVTAVATVAGAAASAGLLYAAMGIGSAITGLATAALPARFAMLDRLVVFISWLALAVVPLMFVTAVPVVAVLLTVLGLAVGPAFITMYSLAGRQVSADQTGVTMTLISATSIVGYAVGSTLGGRFAQTSGPGAAFAVSLTATVVGTLIAVQLRASRRRTAVARAS